MGRDRVKQYVNCGWNRLLFVTCQVVTSGAKIGVFSECHNFLIKKNGKKGNIQCVYFTFIHCSLQNKDFLRHYDHNKSSLLQNYLHSELNTLNYNAVSKQELDYTKHGTIFIRYTFCVLFTYIYHHLSFFHQMWLLKDSRLPQSNSTTVMPAPPNCTCSSWKLATQARVSRYWRIARRKAPVPVPCRIRT